MGKSNDVDWERLYDQVNTMAWVTVRESGTIPIYHIIDEVLNIVKEKSDDELGKIIRTVQ